MLITVDYGHALNGSVGARGCGYKEEVLTREIGRLVSSGLRNLGHTVEEIYLDNASTASQDVNYRVNRINSINPDISISIHLNAFNGSAYGVEVYTKNGTRHTEAVRMLDGFVALGFYNRGVKDTPNGGLALVDSVRCNKAMLIECGFIDNSGDMARYNAQNYANAIIKGITNQTVSSPSTPAPSKPSGSITVGSKVKIVGNKYATGESIPSFVKEKTHTVKEISGSKALMGEIMSWVYINDLTLVGSGSPAPSKPSGSITVGSKVKIVGSKYATGQSIPSFVKEKTHTVKEISGSKALMGEIMSWVYISDLVLVSGGSTTKQPIDVFYKFDNLPWVKNLEDYAGLIDVKACNLYAYPSKGDIQFRVSPVNQSYYPWVENHKSVNNIYDYAGNGVAIDRVQMKLKNLSGYSVEYQVHLVDGGWLPYVKDDTDYAGIVGKAIDAIRIRIV